MATINGCELPDDLYYLVDKHSWLKLLPDGNVRVGMTAAAVQLAGGKFSAVTPKKKALGQSIQKGKSVATVESSKFVGPVPAPVSGTLVQVNEAVSDDPSLVSQDPYGKGWIGEIKPDNWDTEKQQLASGPQGLEQYRQLLDKNNIHCK